MSFTKKVPKVFTLLCTIIAVLLAVSILLIFLYHTFLSQKHLAEITGSTKISSTTGQRIQPKTLQVSLQIIDPDGTRSFLINLPAGDTLCDTLTEAKKEGKIRSVTLDYSYMASFHSAFVKEMNGFQNNWTFTVKGKNPQGCSLYKPNNGDVVVWKFG